MGSRLPKSILISMFALGLTACTYQGGGNANKSSIQQIGDNRQEYMIKNRTDENDYLDMNTDPNMDTRATYEKQMGTTTDARHSGEQTMEQTIRQRVMNMPGIQSAEVNVEDKQITIRFRAGTGVNSQELKKQIGDTISKLYSLHVEVYETGK